MKQNAVKIALVQMNAVVGAVERNVAAMQAWAKEAEAEGAALVCFPELAITGYPPEDLLFKRAFRDAALAAVDALVGFSRECGVAFLFGGLWREPVIASEATQSGAKHTEIALPAAQTRNDVLYNAVFLVEGGEVLHIQKKTALPNYGVFDEKRFFTPGPGPKMVEWRGLKLGILVCEDIWEPENPAALAAQGVELFLSINASPFETNKDARRKAVTQAAAQAHGIPVLYLNCVGGQDELVFDGSSFALDAAGEVCAQLPGFEEALGLIEVGESVRGPIRAPLSHEETIYRAMVLGLKDYVGKNGFPGVVLGLSGGIDSGLTAAVAVDALGAEAVRTVLMPSPYTSPESVEDASACAQALGVVMDEVPIAEGMVLFDTMLAGVFGGRERDKTEENIQARLRGMILMAISNKLGHMVMTTGNKSEVSVGYTTLYGDMCGGYSVLKDVYKTTVFALARWRNAFEGEGFKGPRGAVIPERMITKPPSAELRPGQRDDDSLPPYAELDPILRGLIEERNSPEELAARGFDRALAQRVLGMIYANEYKRRQAPPGVRISGMSFGGDRRYPITNGWR